MNELTKQEIESQETIIHAHEYLKEFLEKFEDAKRGGIHDVMELAIFNMIRLAIKNVDKYLSVGHKQVDATEVMHVVMDSYQTVLDNMKRNMEQAKKVNFK